MGDGDQRVCVIKQVDEFLSSDGFKRAALTEKFLNAKITFLKLLGKWPRWSGQVFPGSELSGQLKRLCALSLLWIKLVSEGVGWGGAVGWG